MIDILFLNLQNRTLDIFRLYFYTFMTYNLDVWLLCTHLEPIQFLAQLKIEVADCRVKNILIFKYLNLNIFCCCLVYGYCTKMGSNNGKLVLRDEDIEVMSKSSGMDAEEVMKAFTSFIAEHPDGKMRPADFKKMMSAAMPKKDAGKMEKHVFRIYDTNNDGYIDFVEFMVIFHIMNDGTSEEVNT